MSLPRQIDPVHLAFYERDSVFENPVLTLREAADFIRTSNKTLYKLVREKEIPFRKVRREYRFLRSELEAWLKGELYD